MPRASADNRFPPPLDRSRGLVRVAVQSCRIGQGALVAIAIGALACGCRSLGSRREAVPQTVATCRQLTEQGISAMDRGDWKRAESVLARAVETCPVDTDARRHYAEALAHRGALQQALEQLHEARRLVGTDPALPVRAGELCLAIGQPAQAQSMADEALALDPKFAPAWALRGRVAGAAGQPRQALANYHRALGYDPEIPQVAILVAETYRQLNEPQRALVMLQSVADRSPPGEQPQQVLYLEGLALSALGRYDEAARSLSLAAGAERPTPEVLCALAEAELHSGHLAKAQSCVQQALAIDPAHAPSRALSSRLAAAPQPGRPVAR